MEVMRELRPLLTRIFNESDKLYEKIATLESTIQELTEELNHYKALSGETAKPPQQTKKEPTIIHFDDRNAKETPANPIEPNEKTQTIPTQQTEEPEKKKRRRGMTEEERRKVKTEQQRLRRQRLKEAENK
jgi:hypothetical protein